MERRRYRLGMADGAYGPGDVEPITIVENRLIPGPGIPDWQTESLLTVLDQPLDWRGELVTFLTINPRYTHDSLSKVRRQGGVVMVGRVRPGHDPRTWENLVPVALGHWGVGVLAVLEA